ncbi:hypothetical protein BGZ54_008562 [Gamsiella multidivaricata]|nr:hypothetical protein BGZ54_008562 [Gamsiella multidivaricata]
MVSSDPSYTPNSNAMAAATAAVSASIAAATGTSPRDGYLYKDRPARIEMDRDRMFSGGWLGGQAQVTMAIPKAPPLDARTLAMRAPPKSILKKRASDVEQNAMDTQNHGVVAPVAIISAGAKITKRENEVDGVAVASPSRKNSDADTTLFLADENVHPMDNPHITPTSDHRAKLVTNSPPPSHPQAHASVTSSIPSCSSTSEEEVEEEEDEDEEDEEEREGEEGESLPDISGMPIGGDGLPTARDDVYLSSKDTRDSIAIHASTSPRNVSTPSDSVPPGTQSNSNNRTQDRELSQAEMLNDEMMSVGARSQGYDRYGGSAATLGGRNVQAPKQRAINFADRIEVIPVHRKSDYNRQSDKHATFLNLTPELKNEIRGELNTFKLREMAVHENSVRNTAFH